MKLFLFTAAISALATWLCTILVQWIIYRINRRKNKRII